MSNKVIRIAPTGRAGVTLREAYRQAIADGYNATIDAGTYNKACAQTMVGFLSAAVIALRLGGDEIWANLCEESAKRLNDDWVSYQTEVPALVKNLDAV